MAAIIDNSDNKSDASDNSFIFSSDATFHNQSSFRNALDNATKYFSMKLNMEGSTYGNIHEIEDVNDKLLADTEMIQLQGPQEPKIGTLLIVDTNITTPLSRISARHQSPKPTRLEALSKF